MTVFKVSTYVLIQLKESCFFLNSEPWNSIQSIQMRGPEVWRRCCFADIYNGKPLGELGGDRMYIGFLPSLKNVLVVYRFDEDDAYWEYSYRTIANTLKLAFGKKKLRVRVRVDQ